jgi:hypothetical protein
MAKDNNNSIYDNQKDAIEYDCLRILQQDLKKDAKHKPNINISSLVKSERPDFVDGNRKIGIEHFLVKMTQKSNGIPTARKTMDTLGPIYKKYHNDMNLFDSDYYNGKICGDLSNITQQILDDLYKFNAYLYSNNFIETYIKHYKKIHNYKCDSIYFLVEIPYAYSEGAFFHEYVIYNQSYQYRQYLEYPPITRGIVNMLKENCKLDCIMLCYHPIIHPHSSNRGCKVIYIDPNNIEESLRCQHIVICDAFDYAYKNYFAMKVELVPEQKNNT